MNKQISKSEYMMFLKHPAWLWLKKHAKSKLPAVTDNLQAIFDAGNLFEAYAEKLFSDGVRIGFSDYNTYLTQPSRTKEALDSGAKVIFQGRFDSLNITCICDVVSVVESTTLDLYEIKSSTSAKVEHEHDLAFQLVVLESCGYKVRNIKVLCVNNEYVRHGNIDPKQLILEEDITDAVKKRREDTKEHIEKALKVIESQTIPDLSPAHVGLKALDEWLEIYRTLTTVEPGSIYDLCRLNVELIEKLEKQGIKRIIDIPDSIELNSKQQLQVRATKENKTLIEKDKTKDFLNSFVYPLYFLDYETLASTVPLFDGLKPYQQVPFQYSLHVIETPGGEVKHFGYLHNEGSNPVASLTESLKSHIGNKGTILTWNQSFEKGRNSEMGCTDEACFTFYDDLNKRIDDLMIPFSSGWYVHKDFLGSASIKKVLPVLVPGLSYSDLDIHEGGTAQRIWMETVIDGKHYADRDKILLDLDKYCELDTLAMVRIYQKLLSIV